MIDRKQRRTSQGGSLPRRLALVAALLAAHLALAAAGVTRGQSHADAVLLAPVLPDAPRAVQARGVFYRQTARIHLPSGVIELASSPDGQGPLCTDDQATLIVTAGGQEVGRWSHRFSADDRRAIVCIPPQRLEMALAEGTYEITIELEDLYPDTYGSTAYYLFTGADDSAPLDAQATATPSSQPLIPSTATGPAQIAVPTRGKLAPTAIQTPVDSGRGTSSAAGTPVPTASQPRGAEGVMPFWNPYGLALIPGILLLGILALARRGKRSPSDQVPALTGALYLFDRETREAHTALLLGDTRRIEVRRYLSDEVHECKGDGSAIGRAFGAMVGAAHKSVGLTGTLFGGYAGDVYSLLCRLGNRPIIQKYGWDSKTRFVDDFGVVDEISKEIVRADEAGHFSGKPMHVVEKDELPGITAGLAMVLQNQSVSVLLKHMGFHLVNYTEDLVTLDMPKDLAWDYEQLEEAGKEIIAWSGNDALSGYLQSTLSYPYQPWNPKTIHSAKKAASGKTSTYTPPAYAHDLVLPHHEWLAEYCAAQVRLGRRVLIYAEHTGTDDLMPDVQAKITRLAAEEHGTTLKVAILRSTTVPAGERKAWFAAREADGTQVVICNPKLVKTGLNLIGWPSIVVLEPVYSLYVLAQAKRRAFRPTQTRDCEVTFLCYEGTMSERAISIVARKAAAAAILNGDDLEGGLMEFDASMSLLQELARMVTAGEADEQHADVRAMLQAGAAALKADLESGTAGLVGALETLELPPILP